MADEKDDFGWRRVMLSPTVWKWTGPNGSTVVATTDGPATELAPGGGLRARKMLPVVVCKSIGRMTNEQIADGRYVTHLAFRVAEDLAGNIAMNEDEVDLTAFEVLGGMPHRYRDGV